MRGSMPGRPLRVSIADRRGPPPGPAAPPLRAGSGLCRDASGRLWAGRAGTLWLAAPPAPATFSLVLACGPAERYRTFPFDVSISAGEAAMEIVAFEAGNQAHRVELRVEPGREPVAIAVEAQELMGQGLEARSVELRDFRLDGQHLPLADGAAAPATPRPRPDPIPNGFRGLARDPGYRQALEGFIENPTVLVEINSRCNFRCRYCRSAHSRRQKSFMPRELFDLILGQLPGITRQDLRLHVDGEPTIHPEFLEMALDANRAGYRLALASNASSLRPELLAIDMELVVNVSCSPEELAERTPMRFERYLQQIGRYVAEWTARDTAQSLRLKIYTSAVEREHPAGLQQKQEFAHQFIEAVGLSGRGAWSDQGLHHVFLFHKSPREFLSLAVQPLAEGGLYPNPSGVCEPGAALPPERGFCDAPWKTLAVLSDGTVSYCCVDVTGETAFADPAELGRTPLRDIWARHAAIARDRQDFLAGRVTRPICRRCLGSAPSRELYLFEEDFPYSPRAAAPPAGNGGAA